MPGTRAQLAEELLRRLAASLRSGQLYSRGHPLITRNLEGLGRAVAALHAIEPSIVIGLVGDDVIVDDVPVSNVGGLLPLVGRLRQIGIERIAIDRGVEPDEIAALATYVAESQPGAPEAADLPPLPHIRVGRVQVKDRDNGTADMAAFRRLYADAVVSAEAIWDSASTEEQPDASVAKTVVDGLAHAVAQNRTTLLALTALLEYDNYTFTHMVNVSILTMAQARALGVEGRLLREFGLAALMHDIGKVKTPREILTKSDTLTPAEFTIMKRHTLDGAEILRSTHDMPTLAPVVAFEHHLRLDGSGYPESAVRPSLNLATMLCSIADVYDAMRTQRNYQQAFPTDRILAVMRRHDGRQFDQHLVRRFAQLVGVYPVGNLVRLNTAEVAVVVNTHASDPFRPHVRVIIDRHGRRLPLPIDVNLWEFTDAGALAPAIVEPVNPADVGLDPLTLL
jgi:putative nucleotidyltransferase with HDIG domain